MNVFITGATGGIGRELVKHFLRDGWSVFAGCLESESVELGAIAVPLDVTSDASVNAARELVGVPELLINNAGIGLLGPMAELPDEVICRQFDVNVRGLARVTRAFAPNMCRRGFTAEGLAAIAVERCTRSHHRSQRLVLGRADSP